MLIRVVVLHCAVLSRCERGLCVLVCALEAALDPPAPTRAHVAASFKPSALSVSATAC
jgi:threonyl-tRNA synthetase